MESVLMCNECLENRIKSDFSDKLIFSCPISDSPLPFSSKAVIKVPNSSGDASSEFVLVYLSRFDDDCLTKYVDDHIVDGLHCIDSPGTDPNKSKLDCSNGKVENDYMSEKLNSLNGGIETDLYCIHCKESSCYYSGRSSCLRTITAIAPCAFVGKGSFSTFENIASKFSSGSLEDDVLCSHSAMIEGKATCRASQNFLNLIGVPSFHDERVPGCLRHPNLVPVFGILKVSGFTSVVYPKASYTLENILHFSPEALDLEWNKKFIVYQLLSAISYIHGLGLSHGNICPSTVMFANSSWVWLSICDRPHFQYKPNAKEENSLDFPLIGNNCGTHDCFSGSLYEDLKISGLVDWPTAFQKWWRGELSNFGYLLFLNRLAGRRWGDHTFHTVMPWVIDFSINPDEHCDIGWRDLSKSKWRLAKGDEQLDFTYSTSEIPHHVSDECLSELAVCSYKARRLPLSVLRMAVRSVYEPNEYPSTMQRLYQWTPDECIPEFYCDSRIFCSLHSGMSDLTVPPWAGSPQEFIKLHRDALESERVSREIHKWIDITFGYKMSGQPAVDAKNVILPSSHPTMSKPIGRRQLFSQPHPIRWGSSRINDHSIAEQHCENLSGSSISSFNEKDYLSIVEEAYAFCEHAQHLSPVYSDNIVNSVKSSHTEQEIINQGSSDHAREADEKRFNFSMMRDVHCNNLLQYLEECESDKGYQEFVLWAQQSSCLKEASVSVAQDIFSLGCVIAELYLRKPLFDSISMSAYMGDGSLPGRVRELPPHVKFVVEACIQKDWRRRPSANCLLECPYFSATVKSPYLFIAPLQLMATNGSRLCYAANFTKKGALRCMGSVAAEICAAHCLPFLEYPLSDVEADCAYILLKEFLKSLKVEAVKRLVLPSIQKILQATGYSHLKVSLLQDSFVRELWNHVGKQKYLEKIHPLVISNLLNSPNKNSASAASVLLISSSEELGVPISVQQTILPLIHCFGKGLCADGVDALVRIGVVLGENFMITQIIPLLKNFVSSCTGASYMNKSEPVQSWNSLALVDCLCALDGLVTFLQKEAVVKILLEGQSCLFVTILMRSGLELSVLQAAATSLVTVCQQIGPDLTAVHVLPQLKELFDELVFSQDFSYRPATLGKSDKFFQVEQEMEAQVESRMDLVLLLYPSLASLLGIEQLRHHCATWLLLEKYLLTRHNWKWEFTGTSSNGNPQNLDGNQTVNRESDMLKNNPTKMLMNGVGWTVPQSQGSKVSKDLVLYKRLYEVHQKNVETLNVGKCEPWFWFPSPASSWDGPDFLARSGTLKDEIPWKIKASVMHSVRAHHGALRSLAVDQDECTLFTAGVGPGFKGMVQRWNMSTVDCVSGYYGHEEVVNDLCIFPSTGRVASCDGTIHVWNSQTGKAISVISESATNMVQPTISSSSAARFSNDQDSMLNSSSHSSGIFTSVDGSLYTCMHLLENVEQLVVGTGNGSIRFIDAASCDKLHMWNSDSADCAFPSLVSAICSCGSDKVEVNSSHSWVAVGLSSGNCRLLDVRSGCVVASWQAHDGYVTKLASPEDHYLVSSSLDKTLRIWDLRKILPPEPIIYKGHGNSILDFSVWGQDVISISKNKIGLSSLAGTADEYGQHRVVRQALYTADRGTRNMSMLSSIAILPFSRLFLVGTEDGQLKVCC